MSMRIVMIILIGVIAMVIAIGMLSTGTSGVESMSNTSQGGLI